MSKKDRAFEAAIDYKNTEFLLTENAGKFVVLREAGYLAKEGQFVVKNKILPEDRNEKKVLERSITISRLGKLKNTVTMLRPERSQFDVWFDGKKYSSSISLNVKSKKLDVKLNSPESKWKGVKSYEFPNPKAVYCFYSQVLECAAVTGFLSKAQEMGYGRMNFYIIWNGYPYFHEQYLNLTGELFSRASLELDSIEKNGNIKLSLTVDNQVIFYVLDKNYNFIKQFWVAQGLSKIKTK